jgi:undecaprenyl-phosphate galactose phosphotransferase
MAREEWLKYKKLKSHDPRVTQIGKFLRKYSLDELPQLINVLKGEMSLVGPRPYIMKELKEFKSLKSILLQVKPGMTGLWQTSGRSLLTFKERLEIDEHYIRNWSLWLDMIIMIKTFKVSTLGKGAF